MRRQLVPHRRDERGEPRDEIEHEEHDDGPDDERDEGGGHEHLAKLHGLLVVPAKALGEPLEDGGELAARLPGANQVDRHRIERFGVAGHRFGEARPGVDRLHHRGDDLSQVEALHRAAKVGERLGDGHARGEELLEVEAEVDELAAAYRRVQRPGSFRGGRRARDEVEVHPAKAGFEVELVRGLHPAAPDAAAGVHRPVAHRDEGHYALPSRRGRRRMRVRGRTDPTAPPGSELPATRRPGSGRRPVRPPRASTTRPRPAASRRRRAGRNHAAPPLRAARGRVRGGPPGRRAPHRSEGPR